MFGRTDGSTVRAHAAGHSSSMHSASARRFVRMRVMTEAAGGERASGLMQVDAGGERASGLMQVDAVAAHRLPLVLDSRESTRCPRSVTHRKIARRPSDGRAAGQRDRSSSPDPTASVGEHGRATPLLDRAPALSSMYGVDSGTRWFVLTPVAGAVGVTELLTTWPTSYQKRYTRFESDAGLSAIWWLSPVLLCRIPVVQITHVTGLRPVADLSLADRHTHQPARIPRALFLGTYPRATPSGWRNACQDEEPVSVLVPRSPFTSWVGLLRFGAYGMQQDGVTSLTHRVEAV